ncbi:ribulose-phosphate 3-epimerase [Microbacterium sp. LRZ72]|uniref:ribulose-phosphate 3-epimerase n=1 Tax=Microbacterium sp. LRZ72 TaxID=2942481 RepID=UPI0029B96E5A|nr:ribulose-phosphate 3-epimerase [Microbacterium sp. LRZ72]MDX2375400.1 ribulose-phosphate 3-epimerase [Microbacterium sp. LRZ72]
MPNDATAGPSSPRINPSILAADFANMQSELARIPGADFVHVDVMDNHFVPNLTFGPQMVQRIQATSPVPLDVHLMIDDPARWAPGYAELGAASVTFHLEAAADPISLARELRAIGARAGVAVKPDTPVDGLFDVLDEFDQILVMTVEPGFGGQSFMPETMPKLRALATEARRRGSDVWLQVDGGVSESTIAQAAEAGADTFVAGSAVFGADDPDRAIRELRRTAGAHAHAAPTSARPPAP